MSKFDDDVPEDLKYIYNDALTALQRYEDRNPEGDDDLGNALRLILRISRHLLRKDGESGEATTP